MNNHSYVLDHAADTDLAAWESVSFLKKVTDVVPGIIYVFNHVTQSNEYYNQSMGTSLGYSAAELQFMGSSMLAHLCHPNDIGRIADHFEELQTTDDGTSLQLEYRVKTKAGEWLWLLSNDTVLERDASGAVVRHIGIATDITARKHAEERAHRAHGEAAITNEELGSFSYSISHDMKAPSNTLRMLLDELAEEHGETLDSDAKELVEVSRTTVDRMGKLIEDVLSYTTVIGQEFEPTNIRLGPLIDDVLAGLAEVIDQHHATLHVGKMPVVRGDPVQLSALFTQLIENAVRFCAPDTRPDARLDARPAPDGNGYVICVHDNGIGIAAEKYEEVFRIFKRLNAAPEYPGTGLGLAICRRVAVNHGSRIDVRSVPGRGSTFSIRLDGART